MITVRKTTVMRHLTLAIATLGLASCLGALSAPGTALALDTPEYTPGENYYIDTPEAFAEQDVGHELADEMSASTQYWVTSAFYLEWISPDMTIYEDEGAFIGCGATGLGDLRYEWQVSTDGGKTFADTGLVGNAHTLTGLEPSPSKDEPYLYRCTITNGDGTATLTADVEITVLKRVGIARAIPQTGDGLIGTAALIGALGCAALALLLAMMRPRKAEEGEETAQ